MPVQIIWKRKRQALRPPKHHSYPATPAAYYNGYYPGPGEVKARYTAHYVRRQKLPQLDIYLSASPAVPAITAWLTHFKRTRNQTHRKTIGVALDEYPVTPAGYYSGYYPGSAAVSGNRIKYKTQLQGVQKLNNYPATPQGYYEGYYPGSSLVGSFRTTYRRSNQVVELNQYPATPAVSEQPLTAFQWPPIHLRHEHRKGLQLPVLNVYTATPPAYYDGYYPGSAAVYSFKTGYRVKFQTEIYPDVYPAAAYVEQYPAWLWSFNKTSKYTNRRIVGLLRPVWSVVGLVTQGKYLARSRTETHMIRSTREYHVVKSSREKHELH